MTFDCSQCLAKCKADCCHGPVPFEKEWVVRQTPIRPIIESKDIGGGMVVLLAIDERTINQKAPNSAMAVCPFLGLDDRCSVYHDRPEVCRLFGTEIDPAMVCSYQDKDGRVRSRQERRYVERVWFAIRDKWMAKMKANHG